MKKIFLFTALILLLLSFFIGRSYIFFLPQTIREPGYYRLAWDLKTSSGKGITVKADNVVLDLDGHTLEYAPEGDSQGKDLNAYGVYVNKRNNFTLVNGTIKGFHKGVRIQEDDQYSLTSSARVRGGGHRIENMTFWDNREKAVNVNGRGCIVRNNRVFNTTGSHVAKTLRTFGIEVLGPACLVEKNLVFNTESNGVEEGVAISLSNQNDGCIVRDNQLYNLRPLKNGRTFGIWVGGQDNGPSLIGNVIDNFGAGIAFSADNGYVAFLKDNRVKNANNSYFGCLGKVKIQDGGGNLAIDSAHSFQDCFNPAVKIVDFKTVDVAKH